MYLRLLLLLLCQTTGVDVLQREVVEAAAHHGLQGVGHAGGQAVGLEGLRTHTRSTATQRQTKQVLKIIIIIH
jgi:hypothetical protein